MAVAPEEKSIARGLVLALAVWMCDSTKENNWLFIAPVIATENTEKTQRGTDIHPMDFLCVPL